MLLCMDAARALLDTAMATRNLMLTTAASEGGGRAGKSQKSLDNLAGRGESTSRHASQGPSPSSGLMTRDASQTRTSHRGLRFHGRAVKLADIDEAKVRAEYAAASKGDDDDSKAAADAAKAMAAAIEVQL